MPTQKAIHIGKSHQLTRKPKLAKEYVLANADRPERIRSTCGNSVYVAIAGEVVNRRSVLLRNFVVNGKESASNPLLHIHAKR
jgi:hypothetical protein